MLRLTRLRRIYATRAIPPPPSQSDGERVLERDIRMVILEAGRTANRRRSTQEQMQCIGGNMFRSRALYPRSMHCVNVGVDDQGQVNWVCKVPELDTRVRFERAVVSFEGWSGPGDPYVRAGSAVVRYELWRVGGDSDEDAEANRWATLIIIVLVIFLVFTLLNPRAVVIDSGGYDRPVVTDHSWWVIDRSPSYNRNESPSSSTRTSTVLAKGGRSE